MPTNPPQTLTRTSHAITIYTQQGQLIGLINSWAPAMARDVTPIYEINRDTSGDPIENVPGNVKGLQISVSRYDVYVKRMEQAFGTVDLVMLSLQDRPFTVNETWKYPDGTTETMIYEGCYFSNIGRQYRSDDQRIVNVTATLQYVRRIRTT